MPEADRDRLSDGDGFGIRRWLREALFAPLGAEIGKPDYGRTQDRGFLMALASEGNAVSNDLDDRTREGIRSAHAVWEIS
jgi:hypothetical protein